MLEHPDITAAQKTGWPRGKEQENRDSPEYRLEYIKDHIKQFIEHVIKVDPDAAEDFVQFAVDGDPGIVDDFVEHYNWKGYRDFLN